VGRLSSKRMQLLSCKNRKKGELDETGEGNSVAGAFVGCPRKKTGAVGKV